VVAIIEYAVEAGADVVYLQDDYGATGRPLISPRMWRTFTYPHLKRVVEVAHRAGVPFMLHSCGYQMPFLEAYVEAGVDILQSFQPKAGNDFQAAYARYGERLTFATGIDTQQGESMNPHDLRESMRQCLRTGRRSGRHILSMTHMMQYTMPLENIRVIFEVVQEIQAGVYA
jgi:uroporphyrinogen decarboxylase